LFWQIIAQCLDAGFDFLTGKNGRRRWWGDVRWPVCYKFLMKIIEQWLLFRYVEGQFTPLSKPFKTKEQAEKARLRYPERQRKTIGLGVIRMKST